MNLHELAQDLSQSVLTMHSILFSDLSLNSPSTTQLDIARLMTLIDLHEKTQTKDTFSRYRLSKLKRLLHTAYQIEGNSRIALRYHLDNQRFNTLHQHKEVLITPRKKASNKLQHSEIAQTQKKHKRRGKSFQGESQQEQIYNKYIEASNPPNKPAQSEDYQEIIKVTLTQVKESLNQILNERLDNMHLVGTPRHVSCNRSDQHQQRSPIKSYRQTTVKYRRQQKAHERRFMYSQCSYSNGRRI